MSSADKPKGGYHSLVGRRKAMQLTGLGAIGLGVAAKYGLSASEPFKDLDDVASHYLGDRRFPFWVKEVSKPTVEIDLDRLKPFKLSSVLFNPTNWGPGEYEAIMKQQVKNVTNNIKKNTPNMALRDYALVNASQWGCFTPSLYPSWDGPDMNEAKGKIPQHPCFMWEPQDYGVPKWTGTPEEASRMMRVAGRLYGAGDVGFVHLDDKMKKICLFSNVVTENVSKGYAEPNPNGIEAAVFMSSKLVLPDKDLWACCFLMPQSLFQTRLTERGEWGGSNYHAYSRVAYFANKIKVFIKSLGYEAYGGHWGMIGFATAFGVMSGLAEYARTGQMISPVFGNTFRTVLPIITDMPLAPTKPINAGILEFCKTCGKCAKACPAKAISFEKEPFWGGQKPYLREGIKGYYLDAKKCFINMFSNSPDCGICQSSCPFSKFNEASVHDVVKACIGTAPALDGVIAKMDDVFGYGTKKHPSSVWDMKEFDVPIYGLEKSRL